MSLRQSLQALVLAVAQAAFSQGALHEAATIPPDHLVPYVFNVECPDRTADGRKIPIRGDYRMENILLALERRKLMPEHRGIRFQPILNVLKAVAWFLEQGDGEYITQRKLAERAGCSTREVRRVLRWARRNGWMPNWNRVAERDRLKADDGRPATDARNSVYLLLALPTELAVKFTSDEALHDLMALGKRKPRLEKPETGTGTTAGSAPAGEGERQEPDRTDGPDFDAFARTFDEERFVRYRDHDGGTVRAENRATIASYISDLVGEACAWGASHDLALDRASVRDDLCHRLVRTWLAWPGTNGLLCERKHPIGLIVGDLAKLARLATSDWKRAQPQATPAAAPSRTGSEATDGEPELDRTDPTPDELDAIRAELGLGEAEAQQGAATQPNTERTADAAPAVPAPDTEPRRAATTERSAAMRAIVTPAPVEPAVDLAESARTSSYVCSPASCVVQIEAAKVLAAIAAAPRFDGELQTSEGTPPDGPGQQSLPRPRARSPDASPRDG